MNWKVENSRPAWIKSLPERASEKYGECLEDIDLIIHLPDLEVCLLFDATSKAEAIARLRRKMVTLRRMVDDAFERKTYTA
ncbi:MAG: hypothetical protein LBK58_04025 [Prevotellaceae bacterium]|jgi:hypothetical protein|nr:hypothetical protein [Prevotellaceae bacterium]